MVECEEAALELLVAHEQFSETVEPAMANLNNPAPGLLFGISFEFVGFLPSSFDMWDVAVLLNDFQGWRSGVACISAQMLVPPDGWVGALEHDGIKHSLDLRNIMPIGPGHDERQRDATPVHQQVAFAPLFSPDRSGCARPPLAPVGP